MLIGALVGLLIMGVAAMIERGRYSAASAIIGACFYGSLGALIGLAVERFV